MMNDDNLPFSELLRPKALQELALPEAYISRMQRMLDNQSPENMLLFGPPGTGKTSAGRIFQHARGDYGHITVDGSKDTGIDYIRNVVEGFASTYPFTPGLKLIFIDDGDYLSKPGQAALRGLIEKYSATCRFIIAVNDVTKIDRAIRSRLLPIQFGVPTAEAPVIAKRIQDSVSERLVEFGRALDRERLDQIVSDNLFDLRTMANKLQWEFG